MQETANETYSSVFFTPEASATNSTFEDALCDALETVGNQSVHISANENGTLFVLPECFWDLAENITAFEAHNVIISGSASIVDPLLRFGANLTDLLLENVVLRNFSSTPASSAAYFVSWDRFFAAQSSIEAVTITNSKLTGSLPATLPASVTTLDLSHNAISGSIPTTLLNNAGDAEEFVLDLSYNGLIGSIPTFGSAGLDDATLVSISLNNNGLTGALPASFFALSTFASVDTVFINVSTNQLSGNIASNFFQAIPASAGLRSLTFDASANTFNGPVPTFLASLASPAGLTDATFILSNNRLSGSVPSGVVPGSSFAAIEAFELRLDHNALDGTVPAGLLGPTSSSLLFLAVHLDNNALTGALPANLFSTANFNNLNTIALSLASNKLNGALPSNFLSDVPASLSTVTLEFSNNGFSGSIPSSFVEDYTVDSSTNWRALTLALANCSLTGSLPADIAGGLANLDLDVSRNSLIGSINLAEMINSAVETNQDNIWLTLNASRNALTGAVVLPNAAFVNTTANPLQLTLDLSYNTLNNLTIAGNVTYVTYLDLTNNTALSGTIPAVLFSALSNVEIFLAPHTNLTGAFPQLSGALNTSLRTLDLSFTSIDFCSGSRPAWSAVSLISCSLVSTNAGNCASSYPDTCEVSVSPSSPSSPANPASPSNPTNPASPSNPASPASPSNPAVPANPATPSSPAPAPVRTPTGDASSISSQWLVAALALTISLLQLAF